MDATVFCLSDERSPGFWIRASQDAISLVRCTDFPALTALISATGPDRPDN